MSKAIKTDPKSTLKQVVRFFVQGLIILAPIGITGYVLYWLFDQWMERTPGIKFIYTSTKDFFEAFAGDKRKFNIAVMASVFSEDVWIIGFLTDEEMGKFEMGANKVAVYVPQAYNFAGQLYILPRDKVKKIEHITPGEAMKYAVTGGVVDLDAERIENPKN